MWRKRLHNYFLKTGLRMEGRILRVRVNGIMGALYCEIISSGCLPGGCFSEDLAISNLSI